MLAKFAFETAQGLFVMALVHAKKLLGGKPTHENVGQAATENPLAMLNRKQGESHETDGASLKLGGLNIAHDSRGNTEGPNDPKLNDRRSGGGGAWLDDFIVCASSTRSRNDAACL